MLPRARDAIRVVQDTDRAQVPDHDYGTEEYIVYFMESILRLRQGTAPRPSGSRPRACSRPSSSAPARATPSSPPSPRSARRTAPARCRRMRDWPTACRPRSTPRPPSPRRAPPGRSDYGTAQSILYQPCAFKVLNAYGCYTTVYDRHAAAPCHNHHPVLFPWQFGNSCDYPGPLLLGAHLFATRPQPGATLSFW
jgi:hypothetical protein